jgi:acyl carrier protein
LQAPSFHDRAGLRARILHLVAHQFAIEPDALQPDANIFTDLCEGGFGSLELTMAIEDEFDVEIPDAKQQALRTLDDVTDYMVGRLGL